MPRRLRLQFEGALYHVINRGNYRQDVFGTVGAAQAFETALAETCERYHWHVHAYVVMRNHFHLALGTPQPNLVEGMHWLQGTFATRFNRYRSERGHLFQGRYYALLIENAAALARVVDYIHLNPVRAQLVPGDRVAAFRWSSLRRYLGTARPNWLDAAPWLAAHQLADAPAGWQSYQQALLALNADPAEQERQGFGTFSRGWAIGTAGWRQALAEKHARLALSPALTGPELHALREARWSAALDAALSATGKTASDLARDRKSAPWKVQLAQELRRTGASCAWIADRLNMGKAESLRVYLHRANSYVTPRPP